LQRFLADAVARPAEDDEQGAVEVIGRAEPEVTESGA